MSTKEFEWHPAKLLEDHDNSQEFALLVLNQPLKNGATLRRLWKNGKRRQICLRRGEGETHHILQLNCHQIYIAC